MVSTIWSNPIGSENAEFIQLFDCNFGFYITEAPLYCLNNPSLAYVYSLAKLTPS